MPSHVPPIWLRMLARSPRLTALAAATAVALALPLTTPAAPATAAETTPAVAAATAFPRTSPARICGVASALRGPAKPPAGAVRVKRGQNLSTLTQSRPAGTTFWLEGGTHTLGLNEFAQVTPKDNNVYIGGPGARLDGKFVNRYAFTGNASGVKIRYLTIQNFGRAGGNRNEGVVNHDSATGWLMERLTVRNNAGAGVFLGSNNVVRYNCLTKNRQYGLSGYKPQGITNVVVDRNEISYNNTDNWELRRQGCGCSGATKFWDINGATVTRNWVHHNKGPGLWADTNNIGFRIDGNYINDNDGEAIFYEISYNALIQNNTLLRNALVKGRTFAARGDSFPVGAIFISESGGDHRVNASVYATLEIKGNLLADNWGGVVLWENANRYCASDGNTSRNYCTVPGDGSLKTCVPGSIDAEPYLSDCRWKTQNVWVHDNDIQMDNIAVGCKPATTSCGMQGLIANFGTTPSWSPYQATARQEAITFGLNNRFSDNRYVGTWKFNAYEPGRILTLAEWAAPPYSHDAGSTIAATAPKDVLFAPPSPDGTHIRLTWRNPVSINWAKTVIRRAEGTRAPATPTAGTAVYSGTGSAVTDRVAAGRTYRYAAFAYDTAGKITRTESRPVHAIPRPQVRVNSPTSTGSLGLPFRVRWDSVSASSYLVEYTQRTRADGQWVYKPWATWRNGTRAGSALSRPAVDGQTLYFRAAARDRYGNQTPHSRMAQAVVPVDDASPLANYSPGWSALRHGDRWLGTEHATKAAGETMTLVAEGSAFTVVGARCNTCGKFRVYVDDVLKATVDARSATAKLRQPLYTVRLPGEIATHRVVIKTVGAKSAPWTRIDAIAVTL